MEIDDADVKSGVLMQGFQVQQVITYRTNPAGPDGSLPHTSQVALICSLLPALPLLLMLSVCDPMDCSPPGSFVHGILQARVLERVAISSSRGIFLTQGSNTCLLHWQADSLQLGHLGRPPLCLPLPHSSNHLPHMLVLMV